MKDMDMNNWGCQGKRKSFKKKRKKKKKSSSGLCFDNFRWHKGSNTWIFIKDYDPPPDPITNSLEIGPVRKRRKKKFEGIVSITKCLSDNLRRSFSSSTPSEENTEKCKSSLRGKESFLCRRDQGKKDDIYLLSVKQVVKLYVGIWDKLRDIGKQILCRMRINKLESQEGKEMEQAPIGNDGNYLMVELNLGRSICELCLSNGNERASYLKCELDAFPATHE
jgi:hypothetical protein